MKGLLTLQYPLLLSACAIGDVADSYLPSSGKPLHLTVDVAGVSQHPIFFDDNIHRNADDSIVAVRVRPDEAQTFVPLTGVLTSPLLATTIT